MRYRVYNLMMAWLAMTSTSLGQSSPEVLMSNIDTYARCLDGQIDKASKIIYFDDQADTMLFTSDDHKTIVHFLQYYRINPASLHHYQRMDTDDAVTFTAISKQVQLRQLTFHLYDQAIEKITWLHVTKSILGSEETNVTLDCRKGLTMQTEDTKLWFGKHQTGITISFK